MSTDYYLVCHECRKRIHIAQDGLSGWSLYSGEPHCMKRLSEWLAEHSLDHPDHRFVLHNEHNATSEEYEEIKWNPIDEPPQTANHTGGHTQR